jgi:hypothetical protein
MAFVWLEIFILLRLPSKGTEWLYKLQKIGKPEEKITAYQILTGTAGGLLMYHFYEHP